MLLSSAALQRYDSLGSHQGTASEVAEKLDSAAALKGRNFQSRRKSQ